MSITMATIFCFVATKIAAIYYPWMMLASTAWGLLLMALLASEIFDDGALGCEKYPVRKTLLLMAVTFLVFADGHRLAGMLQGSGYNLTPFKLVGLYFLIVAALLLLVERSGDPGLPADTLSVRTKMHALSAAMLFVAAGLTFAFATFG